MQFLRSQNLTHKPQSICNVIWLPMTSHREPEVGQTRPISIFLTCYDPIPTHGYPRRQVVLPTVARRQGVFLLIKNIILNVQVQF